MSWSVQVCSDGDVVVTLADRSLSGRNLSEADEGLIRDCAAHLLAFVGPKRDPLSPALDATPTTKGAS